MIVHLRAVYLYLQGLVLSLSRVCLHGCEYAECMVLLLDLIGCINFNADGMAGNGTVQYAQPVDHYGCRGPCERLKAITCPNMMYEYRYAACIMLPGT